MKENKKDCEKIRLAMDAAYRRHDDLHKPILYAEDDVAATKKILKELMKKRKDIVLEMTTAGLSKPSIPGVIATTPYLILLYQELEKMDRKIGEEEQTLADAKKKLAQLERKRENLELNAEEFSRRYKACLEKNKDHRK